MSGTYTVCIAELISIKPLCAAVLPSNRDNRDSQSRTLISISQFKVRWTGYLPEVDTSEPRSNIHPVFKEVKTTCTTITGRFAVTYVTYLADATEE